MNKTRLRIFKYVIVFTFVVIQLSCSSIFEGKYLIYSNNYPAYCGGELGGGIINSSDEIPELFHYLYQSNSFKFYKYGDTCYAKFYQDFDLLSVDLDDIDAIEMDTIFFPYAEGYFKGDVSWKIQNDSVFYYVAIKKIFKPILTFQEQNDSFYFQLSSFFYKNSKYRYYIVDNTSLEKIKYGRKQIKCYKLKIYAKWDEYFSNIEYISGYRFPSERIDYLYLEKKSLAPVFYVKNAEDTNAHVTLFLSRYYKTNKSGKEKFISKKILDPNHYFLKKPKKVNSSGIFDKNNSDGPYAHYGIVQSNNREFILETGIDNMVSKSMLFFMDSTTSSLKIISNDISENLWKEFIYHVKDCKIEKISIITKNYVGGVLDGYLDTSSILHDSIVLKNRITIQPFMEQSGTLSGEYMEFELLKLLHHQCSKIIKDNNLQYLKLLHEIPNCNQ